jgi:hypothetical protein
MVCIKKLLTRTLHLPECVTCILGICAGGSESGGSEFGGLGLQTKTLEEERNFYKRKFEESRQEVQQLKALLQNMHSENQEFKSYCYRLPTVRPNLQTPFPSLPTQRDRSIRTCP